MTSDMGTPLGWNRFVPGWASFCRTPDGVCPSNGVSQNYRFTVASPPDISSYVRCRRFGSAASYEGLVETTRFFVSMHLWNATYLRSIPDKTINRCVRLICLPELGVCHPPEEVMCDTAVVVGQPDRATHIIRTTTSASASTCVGRARPQTHHLWNIASGCACSSSLVLRITSPFDSAGMSQLHVRKSRDGE